MKKYKVRVFIRLRESVSDAAGNAVMAKYDLTQYGIHDDE